MSSSKSSSRRAHRRSRERAPLVTLAPLCLIIILAPHLLGGAPGWAVVLTAMASATTVGSLWRVHDLQPSLSPLPWSAWAFGASILLSCFQLAPLPCDWVLALSPGAAHEQLETARFLQQQAPRCTIAQAPGETLLSVARDAGTLCIFVVAFRAACMEGGRRAIAVAVACSTLILALVALAHHAVGAERVYGLYLPTLARPSILSPLLNSNNLGGLLALGVPILLVLAMDSQRMGVRLAWLAATLCNLTVIALTGSRSSVVVAVACTVLTLGLGMRRLTRSVRREQRSAIRMSAGFALLAGIGAISYLMLRNADFTDRSAQTKWTHIGQAFDFVAHDVPLLGVGRASFAAAFARDAQPQMRPTHAENIIAQWWSDWGLLPAAALLAVLLFDFVRAGQRRHRALHLAIGIGLAALVIQNLADFSLELSGVATVGAAALGAWLAPPPGDDDLKQPRSGRLLSMPFATGALAWIACIAAGGIRESASEATLQSQLTSAATESHPEDFHRLLLRALRLHPAEPAFFQLAGAERRIHGGSDAPRWLERAKQLAPGWPQPHMEMAAWLVRQKRIPEAAAELGQAARLDLKATAPFACALATGYRAPTLLLQALPEGDPLRASYLTQSAQCLKEGHPVTQAVDSTLLEISPPEPHAVVRRARVLLKEGKSQAALDLLQPAFQQMSHEYPVAFYLARAVLVSGDLPRARKLATSLSASDNDQMRGLGLETLARLETKARNVAEVRAALDELHASKYAHVRGLAEAFALRGELEAEMGNLTEALVAYEQALTLERNLVLLTRAAAISRKLGLVNRANEYSREVCQLDPSRVKDCTASRSADAPLR